MIKIYNVPLKSIKQKNLQEFSLQVFEIWSVQNVRTFILTIGRSVPIIEINYTDTDTIVLTLLAFTISLS